MYSAKRITGYLRYGTASIIFLFFSMLPLMTGCGGGGGGSASATLSGGTGSSIERVSVDSLGNQGNGNSGSMAVSSDGRYVAFFSLATNIVSADTNETSDVFIRDRQTGQTTKVSLDSAGVQGNGASVSSAVSADGRYVAFSSDATNLVAGDTNASRDVFVRDLQTGQTARVSVSSTGTQGNGHSDPVLRPAISADGRYVVFASDASNLVAGDTNGTRDAFVHDRQNGQTTRASLSSTGVQGNGASDGVAISADGRYICFESDATNLVLGDTNNVGDLFVRDLQSGQTVRASVDSSGIQGNGQSPPDIRRVFAISGDGRYVVYNSDATNLVTSDTNNFADVFVRDMQTGQTSRVSVDSNGSQGNGVSAVETCGVSSDGRFVVFDSGATNLVAGDTNGARDVFLRDRQTGQTSRVSLDAAGTQGNDASGVPAISSDGRFVVFMSLATNLVSGDTNGKSDVFIVRNLLASPP